MSISQKLDQSVEIIKSFNGYFSRLDEILSDKTHLVDNIKEKLKKVPTRRADLTKRINALESLSTLDKNLEFEDYSLLIFQTYSLSVTFDELISEIKQLLELDLSSITTDVSRTYILETNNMLSSLIKVYARYIDEILESTPEIISNLTSRLSQYTSNKHYSLIQKYFRKYPNTYQLYASYARMVIKKDPMSPFLELLEDDKTWTLRNNENKSNITISQKY